MGVYSMRYDGSYTVGEEEANDVAGSRGIHGGDLSSPRVTQATAEALLWKSQKHRMEELT